MTDRKPEWDAESLQSRFEQADPDEQRALRPYVSQVIQRLASQGQPVPGRLKWIKTVCDQDEFDEMIENMPI